MSADGKYEFNEEFAKLWLSTPRWEYSPIREITVGEKYYSPTGLEFSVMHLAKHAQDCSLSMVVFTNTVPTPDQPAGTVWVMEETLFLKTYREGEYLWE